MKALYLKCILVLVFILMCSSLSYSQEPPAPPAEPPAIEQQGEEPKPEEKKEEKKPEKSAFEKAIEGYRKIEGLFTLYYKEDEARVLLEIKPEQLDKVYLFHCFLEAGDGYFFDSGSMLYNYPFFFHRVGKKVQLVQKNVAYRADPSSPIAKAVERGVSDSVVASSAIVGEEHPETKSILVDASSYFLRDPLNLGQGFGTPISFDPSESYFKEPKSFPKNTEIEVVLNYKVGGNVDTSPAIPSGTSFRHIYRFSLTAVPENDYRPRLADDRMGNFMTIYQDYTDLTRETPYVRYVERWNLQKAFPFQEVSPPKEPIVFWIENTVPEQYRDAIRDGVLEWNKAFEKAGFKDAIVVKQMPDDADWDPADIRYNVIQWIVMPGEGYAVGPSWANPLTGEIYAADVRITADFVRAWAMDWEELVDPMVSDSPKKPQWLPFMANSRACNYGIGKMREMAFGFSVLSARGELDEGSPKLQEFIKQGLKDLVMHEVGHTLGLRHNFKSSIIHSLNEIYDKNITSSEGISGSVMDYNVVNLAPPGKRQGEYFMSTLGPWDYWVIEYAYKPIDAKSPEEELPELGKIASRVADPKLAYGTDEDAMGLSPMGMDPLTNPWDMGSDPVEYYRERIAIGNELLQRLEEKFEKEGGRYQKLRRVFSGYLNPYFMAGATVTKFIGGIYYNRDHIGDPNGRLPFEPVSPQKQREALSFLREYLFSEDSFKIPPRLLNKLAPERLPTFEGGEDRRLDYPLHDVVLSIQTNALDRLYSPYVLNRLLDLPLRYESSKDPFTMAEMFAQLRLAIWSEVLPPDGSVFKTGSISSLRRNLQRAHLSILIDMVLRPGGFPHDAVSLARADLASIQSAIVNALRTDQLDLATRAHLDECLSRINATLNASVERAL